MSGNALISAHDVTLAGNGEIDFQEFMTTLSVASRGSSDEKLHWAFKMYDMDGNGSVSRAEATEMILVRRRSCTSSDVHVMAYRF